LCESPALPRRRLERAALVGGPMHVWTNPEEVFMFTRTSVLALAATAMFTSIALMPTVASAGWWDRYHDRRDIRRDYADIRHDLRTGHFREALHDLRDLRRDRWDLFWDRRGF
jgi:hypothetical protein